jgi:predicted transcriptional regulator
MSKPARKARRPDKLLTEVELELMNILWRLGGGTVGEVLAHLPPERPLAYTSVSTILRILEQKEILRSEKLGRGHRYQPLVPKEQYEAYALEHVVGRVFGGEPLALVRRLVDSAGLSKRDLAELKSLLDRKEREARR